MNIKVKAFCGRFELEVRDDSMRGSTDKPLRLPRSDGSERNPSTKHHDVHTTEPPLS